MKTEEQKLYEKGMLVILIIIVVLLVAGAELKKWQDKRNRAG